MATQIHFGTSGWRAVMAEEFTFANVRRAVTGIARYVVSQKPSGARVIVGRDPRFLGETFCAMANEILVAHGITPLLIAEPAPTPAISYAVIQEKTDGAINFTASHNPPEYNGIKFSTPDGAPALPDVTKRIEAEITASDAAGSALKPSGKSTSVQSLEPRAAYLARLGEIIDFKAIKKANLRVVFDPFWGAARGYSDALLRDAGVDVSTVHDTRDVLFGGHAPEPDDHLLEGCRAQMRATSANIGIATDGDADRFGIVDADGTFFTPNYIVALLFDYLVQSRGWKNGVAKSVATTNLINAVAKRHGVELHETPGGIQVHRRTYQAGQDRNRRGRERRPVDPPSRAGKRWRAGRIALLRDGGDERQVAGTATQRAICRSWFLLQSSRELPLDAGGHGEVHWKAEEGTQRTHGAESYAGGSHRRFETAVR